MQNIIDELISIRQNIRHPSESYVHASAVINIKNKSCRQCG